MPAPTAITVRTKLVLALVLTIFVAAAYFTTLHAARFPAFPVPLTSLDGLLPYQPLFLIPYLSFFALLFVPLALAGNANQLRADVFGFSFIVTFSAVIFALWPTMVRVPPYLLGLALDLPRNACPSLHASLSVYCALCALPLLRTPAVRVGFILWTLTVVASPLFLKRHALIDIVAGASIGGLTYVVLHRAARVEAADTGPVLETLRIRKELYNRSPVAIDALTRQSVLKRFLELGFFVGLAAVGITLGAHAHGWFLLPTILLTAVVLNAFPLMVHEGMHGLLLPNRRANWILSTLLGGVFLMSFTSYRVLHTRHHHYLGDPRDPDDYHNYSRSRIAVWLLHFVRLAFGSLLYIVLIPVLAVRYGSPEQRKLILVEYTLLFTLYSLLLRRVPAHTLFTVWIAPLLLVGLFTAIRGFTQHGITDAHDPYLASRTMLANPVVAFFLLNENYHLEHHLFPEVPSYHLLALHCILWPQLPRVVTGRSYFAFLLAFLRATPHLDETPIGLDTRNRS
jgi:fatty acid desaturase